MKRQYLDDYQAELIRQWWTSLQPQEDAPKGGPFAMFTRADRALLRRCAESGEVLLQSAFQRLYQLLGKPDPDHRFPLLAEDPSALALVAGVLAHVKTDIKTGASFAAFLGAKGESGQPLMSELRFQRLQTCDNEADFYRQAIGAVKLADAAVDVVALADDLLAWIWEYRDGHEQAPAKRLKVRWATDYYGAALK
ncbi:type I-E CRISPR-associated protein Cse2/CasB [Jeongeupia sp. HS-3]|uniref:type I-E CRISPR-associated protein Cse2/CasB n=1 Tax=Jeongeupia sp. HS-3 TaxID=1009682 RepID=UPI0018A38F3F|nr:type I-E CRISPR-associated protein Cse2/CasB [Jeongeupia sp. HS-3]BCL75810.1 type I-E CRISPR-associated protein Cse2/CasB [Jeongeupia sp. HS-3]